MQQNVDIFLTRAGSFDIVALNMRVECDCNILLFFLTRKGIIMAQATELLMESTVVEAV